MTDIGKAAPLPALGIEIVRRKPGLEGRRRDRPFAVEDRKPGGVTVMALDHGSLPEQPLMGEAEPDGGGLGTGVQIVALPFIATISPVNEHPAHHQIHRFGSHRPALHQGREVDMPDLDDTIGRIGAKIACHADRPVTGKVDDGMEHRIHAKAACIEKRLEGRDIIERAVRQIVPDHIIAVGSKGGVKPGRMIHPERLKSAMVTDHDMADRGRRTCPAGNRLTKIDHPAACCPAAPPMAIQQYFSGPSHCATE